MVLASNTNFGSPTCSLSISMGKLEGIIHNKIRFELSYKIARFHYTCKSTD